MSMKLAFLFPGQGSQYAGMARALCAEHPAAELTLREANDILGWDLRKLMLEGDDAGLTRTDHAQPALLAASVAAYRVVREEWGLVPLIGAGHSLGELSALCCSGVLSFPDALKLVRRRGELMHEAGSRQPGTMMAVIGLEAAVIREELRLSAAEGLCAAELACLNASREVVLSGEAEALEVLSGRFDMLGGRAIMLSVSGAFHSRHMKPAQEAFAEALSGIEVRPGEWPVVANLTALPYEDGKPALVDHLSRQLTHPVRWVETMACLRQQGATAVVEIGPKAVLKGLSRKNAPELEAYAIDLPQDCEQVRSWRVRRGGDRQRFLRACLTAAVSTRCDLASADPYRAGVVEPYRLLEQMEREAASTRPDAGDDELERALGLVRMIFAAKRVPQAEQSDRLGELKAIWTGTEYPHARGRKDLGA
jgi:[acyl-carrier-protein] S-malonyltransferase